MRHVIAYFMTTIAFFATDFVWLTQIAPDFYATHLGELMADDVNYGAAAAFYAMFIGAIVFFAVSPAVAAQNWRVAALNGAVLGLISFSTYALTNLAAIRDWPALVSYVDMAWGTGLTGASATLGYFLTRAVWRSA